MNADEAELGQDMPGDLAIPDAYRMLNLRRIQIDRQLAALAADDPARDEVWQELEAVLVKLRHVVTNLAQAPADRLPELRAKAEVLATLFRPDDPDGGPTIPEAERSALVISLTNDVIRLPNG